MLSSIKIDYADLGDEKGIRPMINVQVISSDDPRDKLLQTLFQSAGNHLRIKYQIVPEEGRSRTDTRYSIMLVPEDRDYDLDVIEYEELLRDNARIIAELEATNLQLKQQMKMMANPTRFFPDDPDAIPVGSGTNSEN